MSNAKAEQEELKKLEDEAYFELCQIIAEAMQYQDVELLDARIASWKTKYKKLLDRPSTSSKSDFKKRIEFLLNQYYSEVTQYILRQIKFKEEKKIENQAKALRELYRIIKDTNDLDLLKKKIKKWEEKYPVSGFLNMYQKRIALYTRDKNLKENAFEQEKAFSDLVDITKKNATIDELKNELELWEEKYSINDKYTIDDFIKHQSEVKRFTSDEFLISIARDEPKPDDIDKTEINNVEETFSDLSVQASSYSTLLEISKLPNNISEMFKWVYKNRNIKFNDKYKELILSATYLDYSPTYLNKLNVPNIDISKNSLSYDEYKNIDDIKRYAIISYFNLLLPPEKAIVNDYFTKNIQTVFSKSEIAKTTSKMENSSLSADNILDSEVKISLKNSTETTNEINTISKKIESKNTVDVSEIAMNENIKNNLEESTVISNDIPESQIQEKESKTESVIDLSEIKQVLDPEIENTTDISEKKAEKIAEEKCNEKDITVSYEKPQPQKEIEVVYESSEEDFLPTEKLEYDSESIEPKDEEDFPPIEELKSDSESIEPKKEIQSLDADVNLEADMSSHSISQPYSSETELTYDTVVAFSPLFISAVNNLDKQSKVVDYIDSDVTKYVEKQKVQEISLSEPVKMKADSE